MSYDSAKIHIVFIYANYFAQLFYYINKKHPIWSALSYLKPVYDYLCVVKYT